MIFASCNTQHTLIFYTCNTSFQLYWNDAGTAQIVQSLDYRLDAPRFESWLRQEIFLSSKISRVGLGPSSLLRNGNWGSSTAQVKNYYYIKFLTSQLQLGNIHISWDLVINGIRLSGLIYSLESFLQLIMCQELQIFSFVFMYLDAS